MKKFRRAFLLALISVFCLTAAAQAATNASSQIAIHFMDAGSISEGEIIIDFSITGAGFMKKIGARMSNAGKNFVDISKTFGTSFAKACKTLWTGEAGTEGFMKHAGKAWILLTTALTIGSIANVIYKARHMGKLANKDIMDKNKDNKNFFMSNTSLK